MDTKLLIPVAIVIVLILIWWFYTSQSPSESMYHGPMDYVNINRVDIGDYRKHPWFVGQNITARGLPSDFEFAGPVIMQHRLPLDTVCGYKSTDDLYGVAPMRWIGGRQ